MAKSKLRLHLMRMMAITLRRVILSHLPRMTMMMTMMMETIVIGKARGLITSMAVLREVRGGRVPVELVVLLMRGESGAIALTSSVDVIRALSKRLSREKGP